MVAFAKLGRLLRCRLLGALSILIYSVVLVCAGIVIGRHELLPNTGAASFVKSIGRKFVIFRVGDDKFVNATLKKNYPANKTAPETPVRSIDTSRLPLLLQEVPLGNTGAFAVGDLLIGGALAKVEGSLLVMDKLGNIFVFDLQNKSLHKLDYGTFPNGIREAILNTKAPLPLSAMRAHYMAYDPIAGTLYVSLLKFDAISRHSRFNISAISIDKTTLEKKSDWRTIYEFEDIPDSKSFRGLAGARLLIVGNILYFTIGDFNFGDQIPQGEFGFVAQSLTSSFGKIFEYDLSTHKVRLKSIGHRNPQGLVFTKDGRLLNTEHGPDGGDKLNVVIDGRNYGWPYQTYGTDYGTFSWPVKSNGLANFFEEPLYTWVPSPAISPVIQVSTFNGAWDGDLLIGSLKAESLFRLRLFKDRVLFSEPIWIGHRIRDIVEFDHQIILMTDDPALIIISVDEERLSGNLKRQKQVELNSALAKCISCHHFGETNPSNLAPTLANILNKPIASDNFQRYSEALKKTSGVWDEKSLREFMTNPNEFAPGSAMPNLGLSRNEVDGIISVLKGRTQTEGPP